jgi:NAD(P)-dependent dehydrogenase (short-subunit alcohol dehydrogenase family)
LEKLAHLAEDVAGIKRLVGLSLVTSTKQRVPMSQSLELLTHKARYAAIDPRAALKDSAKGKVVFIAGASRGIGQATAVAFAEAGAKAIYLTARSEDALKKTQGLIAKANSHTQSAYAVCDVTMAAQVEAAVADCVAKFGGIDVADANAGFLGPWVKIGESDPENWWKNWQVNVQGTYHVIRYTIPHLIKSAKHHADHGRSGGHLILLSSVGAQLVMAGASDYQTSNMQSIVCANSFRLIMVPMASNVLRYIPAVWRLSLG